MDLIEKIEKAAKEVVNSPVDAGTKYYMLLGRLAILLAEEKDMDPFDFISDTMEKS